MPATLARTPAQVKRKATRNSIAAKQEHTTDMDMEVDARYDTYGGAEQKPKGSPADE